MLETAETDVSKYKSTAKLEVSDPVGPNFRLTRRASALLFGPPGTSKTSLAEAVAKRLGWNFVELTPSDFLKGGLEGIYDRVNEVFDDLMDLFGTVILFDEMDALVQSREESTTSGELDHAETQVKQPDIGSSRTASPASSQSGNRGAPAQLDVTQTFLTTSMLPKLLKLRKQGRTIFFMATNYQSRFDPAIKRPGRFDLLIRMGPPTTVEKIRGIRSGMKDWLGRESDEDKKWIQSELPEWIGKDGALGAQLDRFLFGEMTALFDYLRREDAQAERLKSALEKLKSAGFKEIVNTWFTDKIALRDGGPEWKRFDGIDKEAVEIQ